MLSLVDSAQAFGVLDVNLSEIKPDFFTGSMHKWPCGPKEKGVLFVNRAVQDRIAPSIYGVYGGAVGISRTFEAEGQRDDAAMAAVVEALKFQADIGRAAIEKRVRDAGGASDDGALKARRRSSVDRPGARSVGGDRDLQAGRARPEESSATR